MLNYREVIYNNYFTNQVNKLDASLEAMLAEQVRHNSDELAVYLPSDKDLSIVDLGCGFGTFVKAANNLGYHNAKGYDISKEQVEVANKLGVEKVYHKSIEDYFKDGEKVDVIVGLDIIEHLTKDELIEFLANAKNSLKKNGRVIFRTPNMDAPQTSIFAYGDISHEVFLNKSSALQVFNSIGFKDVKVSPGLIKNANPLKELVRRIGWFKYVLFRKIVLFCSGRTWHNVVFAPNLIITASI